MDRQRPARKTLLAAPPARLIFRTPCPARCLALLQRALVFPSLRAVPPAWSTPKWAATATSRSPIAVKRPPTTRPTAAVDATTTDLPQSDAAATLRETRRPKLPSATSTKASTAHLKAWPATLASAARTPNARSSTYNRGNAKGDNAWTLSTMTTMINLSAMQAKALPGMMDVAMPSTTRPQA